MHRRIIAAIAVLVNLTLPAAQAGEAVLNYEFTNGPSSSFTGLLSSPGGTYWNTVNANLFSGTGIYDSTVVRDQFGNSVYRDSDPLFGFGYQRIPVPRTYDNTGFPAQVIASPATIPLGSLRFGQVAGDASNSVHLMEFIGAYPTGRYDIAVYFKGVDPSGTLALPGTIELTQFGLSTFGATPFTTPSLPPGYFAALFTDVQPQQMHIGFPQIDPLGFGISYFPTLPGGEPAVQLAGIQIRGVIPEPSSLLTACLGLLGLAIRGPLRLAAPLAGTG
jgi:hypothetical protein